MRLNRTLWLVALTFTQVSLAAPLYFSCRPDETPTHILHLDLRVSEDGKCTALAVDAHTGNIFNSNWSCDLQEISQGKQGKQILLRMRVEKVKGIGEEPIRFDKLNAVIFQETGSGGGIAEQLSGRFVPVLCTRENGAPPRLKQLDP